MKYNQPRQPRMFETEDLPLFGAGTPTATIDTFNPPDAQPKLPGIPKPDWLELVKHTRRANK